MARAPKVIASAVESVEPSDPTEAPVEPVVSLPPVPAGDPLSWTVEQWLAAAEFPIERVKAILAARAAHGGVASLPLSYVVSLLQSEANPAILARMFALTGAGLIKVFAEGKGPVGHSGSDLVG